MLTTCIFCHQAFPGNETLEEFPVSRRVAYDPARGRLWAVCPSCSRWTLAPFESRWEALEAAERITRDRARLLGETDNVSLLTVGDLEIVRVGRADLREESWWRYGREFSARRKRAKRTVLKGKVVDALLIMLVSGVPFWGLSDPEGWLARARRKEFGRDALRGAGFCSRCGRPFERLRFADKGRLVLRPGQVGPVEVWYGCPECGSGHPDAGVRFSGAAAERLLRRLLSHSNFTGSTEAGVTDAMDLVESYDSSEQLIERVARRRNPLSQLSGTGSLALEIALNADVERRLLEMELAELEARWREEEEIASIADRL